MDPERVVDTITGGIVVQGLRVLWDNTIQRVVSSRFAEASDRAKKAASANAQATATKINECLGAHQRRGPLSSPEQLEAQLADPDVAITVAEGLAAGARTGDPGRQETVARLVAERLTAPTDSPKAAAARQAIAVLPQLASDHLATLGLIALIRVVRPAWIPVPPQNPQVGSPEALAYEAKARAALPLYREWFATQIAAYSPLHGISSHHTTQLESVGCVVRELISRGDLYGALAGAMPDGFRYVREVAASLHDATTPDTPSVREVWKRWLDPLRLTPAGLLLGLCVHDAKTGGSDAQRWNWSEEAEQPHADRGLAFLGELADPTRFRKIVTETIADDIRRQRRLRGDASIR